MQRRPIIVLPPSQYEAASTRLCSIAEAVCAAARAWNPFEDYSCCTLQLVSIAFFENRSWRKRPAMTSHAYHRGLLLPLVVIAAMLIGRDAARAQNNDSTDLSIELVDPKVLRVCADPRNLPFSNEKGEGFENKLAELFAEMLQKKLDYMYFPQATGFVRVTLGSHRCDVIMGFPQGDDLFQGTNPYYRTAYALVAKPGSGLDDVATLEDARLKDKRIGIVAGTPPATNMAVAGLMANARPYPLMIDTRFDSSSAAMIKDLMSGEIDAGVLWGPMAGYYAKQASPP